MAWREELDGDDTSGTEQPAQTAWYALARADRAGLLAEQEYEHTKAEAEFRRLLGDDEGEA